MPSADDALPGRDTPIPVPERHFVLDTPLEPPFPDDTERAVFGMGCFWGAERIFWQAPGVYTTAVGYAGGFTPNPTYEEVCSGRTGHNEVVLVVFRPAEIPYEELLRLFWEGHDPTQGMRQGNDVGTQYRSGHLHRLGGPGRGGPGLTRRYAERLNGRRLRRDHHRDRAGRARSTTPRTTTSSTSRRTRTGTAGIGGTGVSCPVGVAGV